MGCPFLAGPGLGSSQREGLPWRQKPGWDPPLSLCHIQRASTAHPPLTSTTGCLLPPGVQPAWRRLTCQPTPAGACKPPLAAAWPPPLGAPRLHGRLRLPDSWGRPGCLHPRTRGAPAACHLHSILSVILDSALGSCHCCRATGTRQAFGAPPCARRGSRSQWGGLEGLGRLIRS